MKKILLIMMISASLFACNNEAANDETTNDSKKTDKRERTTGDDDYTDKNGEDREERDVKTNSEGNDRVNANWTREDENEFLRDCREESGNEVVQERLNDFCSCMLEQARKNYKNYAELDKSNTEVDLEVFGDCIRKYSNLDN
jgi:hypothetical protein